ncbi:MAG: SHOCT-like domain-containing protein [Candidatus Limnocylindrales bacterium]
MTEALERVLRLVSDGRVSAEEAAPIIAALEDDGDAGAQQAAGAGTGAGASRAASRIARQVRIEVTERGRSVVNLRVPVALGQAVVAMVPGLSPENSSRLKDALTLGEAGPILDVLDEDGDGVRIVLE